MDGGTFDSAGHEEPEPKAESCDEASGTSTTPSAGWNAAATHASLLGKTFKARVEKLCGKDWYRLRRILEVAYTIGAEKATEEQLEAVYSGERFGGLGNSGYDVRCFFLCPDDRLKHAEVIDRRCEDMLLRGLLTETADLSVAGELPDNGHQPEQLGTAKHWTISVERKQSSKMMSRSMTTSMNSLQRQDDMPRNKWDGSEKMKNSCLSPYLSQNLLNSV